MKRKVIGIALLAIGIGLIATASILGVTYLQTTQRLKAEKQAALTTKVTVPTQTITVKPETVQGTPVKIEIPSVGITQTVDKGEYDSQTGDWTLSYHAVYWATMTAPINSQAGNTFIYGHDVKEIFGNLLNAKTGAKAIVTTDNGYKFTYTLASSQAVSPTDTSYIQPTTAPVLTLQTCSGSWYQYRQMFRFTLDGYEKAS